MLKHVSFVTADTDAVIRFYTLLGAEVSKDLVTGEGFRRLVLSFAGGGKLQFFQHPEPQPGGPARPETARPDMAQTDTVQPDLTRHTELQTKLQDSPDAPAAASQLLHPPLSAQHAWMEHVALHLPDLKASAEALRAQGVTFSRELTLSPSGNPMAFVLDPDGRQVELLQAGA